MELTPIEFIAQMINEQIARAEGYDASTRWGTLREDLKVKYKAEAEKIFEEWKTGEIEAEKSRNKMMEGIVIKTYGE
jgi:hypothetical protein